LIDTFHADGIQGVLLTPTHDCKDEIQMAIGSGMKVVMMNRHLNGIEEAGSVTLDNEKAMKLALDHLIECGYRKIELVSNEDKISTLYKRIESYKQIMTKNSLEPIVNYVEKDDAEGFENMVREAHTRGVDAFVIPRGYLTLYLCKAIKDLGYRIPEDFAVIGFDGGLNYRIMTPTVSQIIQSPQDTAEESYRMLIEMMQNNIPGNKVLLQPSLEVGDSTKGKL
jgi:DNA-binding LacI/PurR family transcriptional regulator